MKTWQVMAMFLAATIAGGPSFASSPANDPKLFAAPWIDGSNPGEPAMQVQQLDADTFVLRQSLRTNFEGPFLYLLFGKDRALLVDTGAGGIAVRPVVDRLIAEWLAGRGRASIPLVVAHSHSHRDHVAGDAEFRDRPETTLVGLRPEDVAGFFGIGSWPDGTGSLDLGGRRLTILPTPGHQIAHVMIYDPRLRIMVSGDALYPGRIYVPVNHLGDMRRSIARVASFVRRNPVRAVLGAHIELDRGGEDYAQSVTRHPNERRLELAPRNFEDLRLGLAEDVSVPMTRVARDSFIILSMPTRPD